MANFHFTFGSNHVNSDGVSLGNCYVTIEAPTEGNARHIMSQARGLRWSFTYTDEQLEQSILQYGCHQVSLEYVKL